MWPFSEKTNSHGFNASLQVELKHTVEILHEEQERIVKIETIKKSFEVEVKVRFEMNLTA